MEDLDIRYKVETALEVLLEDDEWLLVNDMSEQSISHKFAEKLQFLFREYNVDCEYNGDIESPNDRKHINLLKLELVAKNLLKEKEEDGQEDTLSRAVFPDIIIHERGSNDENLCIIEVKKSTSTVKHDYDRLKLSAYTTSEHGNNLKYQLGIFVIVTTGNEEPDYDLFFYKDGQEVVLEEPGEDD